MTYLIYILYSNISNIYYVGHANNVERRVSEHNNPIRTKFTSKHIPWVLKCSFVVGETRSGAMQVERFIKKKKNRKYIEQLITDEVEQRRIVQLVRVPPERD